MLRPWLAFPVFATLAVIAVACGSSPTPTPSPAPTPSPGPVDDADEANALRQLAFAYWEAFNAYDADKALGYLEEDYRRQRNEEVRGEIAQISLFRVKLGVSEETSSEHNRPRRTGAVPDHERTPGHAAHPHGLP